MSDDARAHKCFAVAIANLIEARTLHEGGHKGLECLFCAMINRALDILWTPKDAGTQSTGPK